jgi:phospholipid/cholesterol/gamma-HCH transport system substrate-binding protein
MPRARSWGDLKVGTATLALVVASAAAVLAFARVGALHGDTIRLYAVTPHARGILPGSEVWLAGRKIGLVRNVGFRPPSTDTTLRVLLTLDVLEGPSASVRRTADVSIRAGGSLIGAPVVAIAPATTATPAVQDGDTLVAAPQSELESIRTRLTTTVGTEVPVILDNVRVLGAQLETARGTLGALGVEGPRRIGATAGAAGAFLGRATGGSGTMSLALGRGDLPTRARAVLARIDSLRALATASSGTVGRVRTDTALRRSIESARAEVNRVQALLAEPRGTAGRLQGDRILQLELARARAELDLIFADLRRNPLRYVNP